MVVYFQPYCIRDYSGVVSQHFLFGSTLTLVSPRAS